MKSDLKVIQLASFVFDRQMTQNVTSICIRMFILPLIKTVIINVGNMFIKFCNTIS